MTRPSAFGEVTSDRLVDAAPSWVGLPLRLRPAPQFRERLRIDTTNWLVDVDAGASLPALSRALARAGYVLLLPRPLPALSIASFLAQHAQLMEGLLHSATVVTANGESFETKAAPRYAMGPSTWGYVALGLACLARVRLRVVPKQATQVVTLPTSGSDMHALCDVINAQRAFAVSVCGAANGWTARVLLGRGSPHPETALSTVVDAVPSDFVLPQRRRWRLLRAFSPQDVSALVDAVSSTTSHVLVLPNSGKAFAFGAGTVAPLALVPGALAAACAQAAREAS